jgi:hypothetical protein
VAQWNWNILRLSENRLTVIKRWLSLLVLLLFLDLGLAAQSAFLAQVQLSAPVDLRDVKCFDLDGDGDLDILPAFDNEVDFIWFENDGDNNFEFHRVPTETPVNSTFVSACDIDGDGDLDVIEVSFANLKI